MNPGAEEARRRDLAKHKAIATGLLLLATAIYITMRWLEFTAQNAGGQPSAWVGYVRAASEAGMVGALADWFAVTALFRHPLGIPIPHTAIIKKKKDQVGHSLSEFVGENFLNSALITEKLRNAKIPERLSDWVLHDGGSTRIARESARLVDLTVNGIDPVEAEAVIERLLIDKAKEPDWAAPLGRGLQQLIAEGRTEPAIEAIVEWMDERARTSEDFVVRLIDERTPTWAPRFIRDLVGAKVYHELVAFTADVRHNKNHDARKQIQKFLVQLADDLQHDAVMRDRIENFKQEVLSSGPVRAIPGKLWQSVRRTLTDMARDDTSLLWTRIEQWTREFAQRIQDEPALREELEHRIVGGAAYLADNYAGEVTGIIGETVERWDAREASDRIELMVGKDLQFIRVNGTVVGALAGLAIYTLTELFFMVA